MNESKNWVTHPTKKVLILCISVWLIGNTLLVLGTTNLFQESLTVPVKGLMAASSVLTFGMFMAYFKNKDE
jgi:hypothetical protein